MVFPDNEDGLRMEEARRFFHPPEDRPPLYPDGAPALLRHITGSFPHCPLWWLDLDSGQGFLGVSHFCKRRCSRVEGHEGVHI